jgi:hypothetical protein
VDILNYGLLWILNNWQWILSILIPSLVLYYTITNRKERRLQTTLNEFGEPSINLEIKVKPFLHNYSSIKRNVKIGFRFKKRTNDGGYKPISPPESHNTICIGEIESAKRKSEDNDKILITCSTSKLEECRKITTSVIENLTQI